MNAILCNIRQKVFCSRKVASIVESRSKSTIAVAMSGGIDSSVTALLLQQQGYDCIGVFMQNWDNTDEVGSETCPIDQDRKDMIQVCDRLKIPYVETQFIKEYWNDVFEPMLHSYSNGVTTPNPDVECNRVIKFDALKRYINKELGIVTMATGHYARTENDINGQLKLLTGIDTSKDQSYFLCRTSVTIFFFFF